MLSSIWLVRNPWLSKMFPKVVFLLVVLANYAVFCLAPDERVMGAIQRIFYFHVGAALATYAMLFLLALGSALHLAHRSSESRAEFWDDIASSAASIALLWATLVLLTGMIWGKAAWNVWWRWEPRLVSFLVLWLILAGYTVFRSYAAGMREQSRFAAVLGVVSALNVPIVIYSVKLLDHREQLHPQVVANQGLTEVGYIYAFVIAVLAMLALSGLLLMVAFVNKRLKRELGELIRECSH